MQPNRLPSGGRIDRAAPVRFAFNGRGYEGYQGDTLASALLANDVRLVARSFKYHRPRGIVGAGVEEPNALVQLGSGDRTLPNYLATQIELFDGLEAASVNAWPSVDFDLRAVNGLVSRFLPPGFYYKTFMWPRRFWPFYERQLRKAGGFGVAPSGPDPDRYDKMNAHCDVLVVGSGPAGLAAALRAGRTGARVILVDEQQEMGGSLLASSAEIDGKPASAWVESTVAELAAMPEVRLLPRSTAFGYYDHNFVTVLERVTDHLGPGRRPYPQAAHMADQGGRVVLATGSIERPLVFPNNDRPGVMLASAVSTYVNRYGVAPGSRAVVFTNNDSAYRSALELASADVEVSAIVDLRPDPSAPVVAEASRKGIEVLAGHTVTDVDGGRSVGIVGAMRHDGASAFGGVKWMECDLVAMSGGWNPAAGLYSQSGGKLRFDDGKACFVPNLSAQGERSAGSSNGAFSLEDCLAEGWAAGAEAAAAAGFADGEPSSPPSASGDVEEGSIRAHWLAPGRKPAGRSGKSFVDLQTDTTAADIFIAAREGYESIEHVKRYTTLGMGTDQGKTGAVNGVGVLAEALGVPLAEVGTTTFRQPYSPVTYGAIAGREVGELFDPVRKTAIHEWHVESGAEFENVGQWKRPWYYPEAGRVDGRCGEQGVHRCAQQRRRAGRLHPWQDRHQGAGRRQAP